MTGGGDASGSTAGAQPPGDRERVLFVCTHNSARSIMAEALLRDRGDARFEAFSAGTQRSEIRPLTMRVLEEAGLATAGLRSKSVDELRQERFDYVITVCDLAQEVCPVFPGGGQRLHWSFDDPSLVGGNETMRLAAFRRVFGEIREHIMRFVDAT